MSTDWDAEIDHRKDRLSVSYTDRRAKPYHHLTVTLDDGGIGIVTKRGQAIEQKIVLRNKSMDEIMTTLRVIDCPARQIELVRTIVKVLTEEDQ